MNPIRLTLDGNVEVLIVANTAAFESKARRVAEVIAGDFGLERNTDDPSIPTPARLPHQKLQRVQAFIEEHLASRLRVDMLASVVHMSPFHFTRLFKQATGLSPHAYVTVFRGERAKRILAETPLPLIDVAASVGFQTQGHFTEVFRRHAGTTPRRFRRQAMRGYDAPDEPAALPAAA